MPDTKRYDVVQPYTYEKDGKEITRWTRVGIAFPRLDDSGRLTGFTLRFNASPPFPDTLVVAEQKPKQQQQPSPQEDTPF